MSDTRWTKQGEEITSLILEVFQLNGRLLLAGDRLIAELGLTSARWQILGAIALADRPESVAWHARRMGVHRQGIQRIVNELKKEGIIDFQPNPNHKRAHLIVLTSKGKKLYADAMVLQVPWVNELAKELKPEDIETTRNLINELKARLENQPPANP